TIVKMSPAKIIKRKTGAKTMPKTDPKEQRLLKSQFKDRARNRKVTSAPRRPSTVPPCQRVWRRTIIRPKPKPKVRLPRLFRVDRMTGLPLDYERTVERVMHYVNPHLGQRLNNEQVMEELLTNMFAQMVRQDYRNLEVPQHVNRHLLRTMIRENCPQRWSDEKEAQVARDRKEANDSLSHFHSVCKRGPRQSPRAGPTYSSKFNFNQLRIKST
ncbi:hypothetical protein KR009_000098, partial [Drosophila setifemur]